jgi:hypothetical protein
MASHAAASSVSRTGVGGGGQVNMGFVPEIWSGRTLKALDDKSYFLKLVNRDYEGDIKGKGDTVRIHHVGNIQAKSYAIPTTRGVTPTLRQNEIVYQTATGASILFSIDKADYFAFEVEDIEAAQADPKYVSELTSRAGTALAQSVDRYIMDKMLDASGAAADGFDQAGGGHTHIDVATVANVYNGLVDVAVALDDNLCPEDGRFVVVPSFCLGAILKDDRFVGAAADGSGRMRDKGYVGNLAGFQVYTLSRKTFQNYTDGHQSTQVLADTTTAINLVASGYTNSGSDDLYRGIAGVKDAFTFADQITKTENVRLEGSFADGVRGLHVYGGMAVRPQWLHEVEIQDTQ